MKNSRAISRLIAVVILIVILAIAGGVDYFVSTLNTSTKTASSCNSTTIQTGTPRVGALAYDPNNSYVYASTRNGLVAINPSSNTIIENLSLGFDPSFVGYNPGNNLVYAIDSIFSLKGSAFDPQSGNVTGLGLNESSYSTPDPASYNPSLNVYYSLGVYGFYVVNATSNKLETYVLLGTNIQEIAFDNSSGVLYIANGGNGSYPGSVYAVKSGPYTLTANITEGPYFGPSGVAFDSANRYLYVTDIGSIYLHSQNSVHAATNNVSIIDTKTNRLVKTVVAGVGLPSNPIYVERDSRIYFSMMMPGGGLRILGIDDRTNTIVSNTTIGYTTMQYPTGMIYDPQNSCLFVSGSTASGSVNIVTVPAG